MQTFEGKEINILIHNLTANYNVVMNVMRINRPPPFPDVINIINYQQ